MGSRSRKRRRSAGERPPGPRETAPRRDSAGDRPPGAPGTPSRRPPGPTEAHAADRVNASPPPGTTEAHTPDRAETTPSPRPPAPIGARSADRARTNGAGAPEPIRDRYARGRERDELIRASLEPLRPGERPGVLTLAAIVAFAFAIANAAAALSGNDIASPSGDPTVLSIVTTALLVVAGVGMLARQYWAVLGMQTILAIQIIFLSLYLIGVQQLWRAIVTLVAIVLFGWLFWKLVRLMARLQMPERRSTQEGR